MFVKILCRRLLEPMPNAGLLGRGAGAVQPWSKVGIGNFAVKNLSFGYDDGRKAGLLRQNLTTGIGAVADAG